MHSAQLVQMAAHAQLVPQVITLIPMHVLVAQTYILSAKNVLMLQHAQAAIQAMMYLQVHVFHVRAYIVLLAPIPVHALLAFQAIMLP